MGRKQDKWRTLDALVFRLQKRHGPRALRRRASPAVETPHVSTGFEALDTALGIGGIPRGRITECIGGYTSGKTTVVLKTMAQATGLGDAVAFIDLERTFNPDYAQRAGVDLSRVVLPPAEGPLQALEIIPYLVAERGIGMVVFNDVANLSASSMHRLTGQDGTAAWLSATLRQITGALHQSHCALIFLTTPWRKKVSPRDYPSGFALAHFASVRLGFEMTHTLRRRDGTRGFRVQVQILKNRLAALARKPVTLNIFFNGTVESNGII